MPEPHSFSRIVSLLFCRRMFLLSVGALLVLPTYCTLLEFFPPPSTSANRVLVPQAPPGAEFHGPHALFVNDVKALQHDLAAFGQIQNVSVVAEHLSADDAQRLARLTGMRELSIFHAESEKDALSHLTSLPNLERLHLHWTTCQPSGWSSLASFQGLSRLSLVGSDIPEDVLDDVKLALADCKVVSPRKKPAVGPSGSSEGLRKPEDLRRITSTLPPSSRLSRELEGNAQLLGMVDQAIRKAGAYLRRHALAGGGYVRELPAELKGPPGTSRIALRPPGTADVGRTYLAAYRCTGDPSFLDAALDTGGLLVETQLATCGWNTTAELDPIRRRAHGYRVDDEATGYHSTYLDYRTTRVTVEFLMTLDEATGFQHSDIHEAAIYCLEKLLAHQYPNGAWPQWIKQTLPNPDDYPIKLASFPATWSRIRSTHGYRHYRYHYTINDNTITNLIHLLLQAAEIYEEPRYQDAALRAGDFLLLAQLPDPQPAWAQQYNSDMHPSWGRSFEPPAITGRESQVVIDTLLDLYDVTGRRKYLDAAGKAIAYLEGCALPDGRLARFYEQKTNRPLYVTRRYMLTYSDRDLIEHYSMKAGNALPGLRQYYEDLRNGIKTVDGVAEHPDEKEIERIVEGLDHRGAWVEHDAESDRAVVRLGTFIENMQKLSQFLSARKEEENIASDGANRLGS